MPNLYIRVVNCDFESRDDGARYDSVDTAMTAGVQAALRIAADEMVAGKANVAVEIRVEGEEGTAVSRSVVALSVSPLLVAAS